MEPQFPVQESLTAFRSRCGVSCNPCFREGLSATNEKLEQRLSAFEMIGASNVEAIAQVQQALVANESQVCALSRRPRAWRLL